jgi:thiol:disulfide interchange protein DsbD
VTLRLTVGPDGLNPAPHELHFFSEDNLVAYDQPQGIVADGRAGYVFTLPLSPDGPTGATRLLGVITAVNGWRADGTLPGLKVDIPFGLHASTVANPVSATALPPSTGPANGGPTPLPPGGSGLGGTLILAFLGGLILNLMPCVFPVLGIKVLGFVNQAGAVRSKVVAHGVVFSAGVILSFWALAGVLAILRQGGNSLGWGFQLQSPGFIYLLAAVMLAFALNLSGVFEFGLSATGIGGSLQSRGGYVGSFLTGVLATIVATPCSAPFLAPALGAALALSFASAFAVFTAIAIGLSTPYLLLSIFPAAVRVLPRPGAWMETFRQLMAFPLYASVAYLAWVLAGQLQENALMNALFGLVLIALAVWIYGRCSAPGSSVFSARFGMIAGALVLALGAWNGWPVPPAPTDIVWQKWSPETVARLRGAGRIVYVDFTARWCATCQANKRVVFHSPEVLKEFRAKHIATLRGDWTNRDAQVTGELAKYHRSAVPFNEVWVPGRPTPIVLPEILTPGVVLRAVGGS